jgi:predicted acetyltransferase
MREDDRMPDPRPWPGPVTLRPVSTDAERSTLLRLVPLYTHDQSEYADDIVLLHDGTFDPESVAEWLADGHVTAYLIRAGHRLAGYAVVARPPFAGMRDDVDRRLVQFFVARPFRRAGVGTAAAMLVLDTFAGRWEVNQLAGNAPAIGFWRRVLPAYLGGPYHEEEDEEMITQVVDTRVGARSVPTGPPR